VDCSTCQPAESIQSDSSKSLRDSLVPLPRLDEVSADHFKTLWEHKTELTCNPNRNHYAKGGIITELERWSAAGRIEFPARMEITAFFMESEALKPESTLTAFTAV
jgi:hypothetical protein